MHAYLFIGKEPNLDINVQAFIKKIGVTVLEFPLLKIEDARTLLNYTKFSLSKPQAVYIKGIDKATVETQNAFLKSLEEPQKNLYYILSASTIGSVLPTIASRCQIIQIVNKKLPANKNIAAEDSEYFNNLSQVERLKLVDKFKKREEAINFLDDLINIWHQDLVRGEGELAQTAHNLKQANTTYNALKTNGNILLQMTNFIINIH